MKKIFLLFLIFFIVNIMFIFSGLAFCQKQNTEKIEINRNILAIYNSTGYKEFNNERNYIYNNLEVVLNNLGFNVIYHDIKNGLPSEEKSKNIYAIISWFKYPVFPNPSKYCDWIEKQVKAGKKFIMFGENEIYRDTNSGREIPLETYQKLYSSIGLEYEDETDYNPFFISVKYKNENMMEFERTLDNDILFFSAVKLLDKKGKCYLKLESIKNNQISDAVCITQKGGFALDGCEIYNVDKNQTNWFINPFLFLKKALAVDDNFPIFDLTTLYGNRILYSHIDGDGFRNVSYIDNSKYSSEIIYEEFKKYGIPTTVSFIVSDIDKKCYGRDRFDEIFSEIAKLNNVELGIHGYSHPLDWKNKLTAVVINGYSKRTNLDIDELDLMSESAYSNLDYLSHIYVSYEKFFQKEIVDSKIVIENMLKDANIKKSAKVFQWTGNCEPQTEAVKLCYQNNLLNINGVGSIFDESYPSYTGLKPFYTNKDGYIQVYATNLNENIYTNDWTEPYFGFEHVIETFRQTEIADKIRTKNVRRILPMNIYYHFYSGERQASLDALSNVYDYVIKQNAIPIFTSRYIQLVLDFTKAKIYKTKDGAFILENYGKDNTVRLENNIYVPDLKKCIGVLGFCEWNNFVYIHLKENGPAKLYLIKKGTEQFKKPYLEKSNVLINDFNVSDRTVKFNAMFWNNTKIILKNLAINKNYRVIFSNGKKTTFNAKFKSDNLGRLNINSKLVGKFKVEVDLIG